MRTKNSFLTAIMAFASVFLMNCNGSVKGKWSDSDKQRFDKVIAQNASKLAALGADKDKWVACYLRKCEAEFSSFASADKDKAGCERLAKECATEVFANGSVKGKWSDSDKTRFKGEMDKLKELDGLGEMKNKWVDCYLEKCEARYASFYEADHDRSGANKALATECNKVLKKRR